MAHTTTAKRVEDPNTVVTGTLPILGYLAYVLFNSGFIHSFIVEEFVKQAKLELEPLEIPFTVSTPAEVDFLATQKVKGGKILISAKHLEVMLIVIDMTDFGVILGMDWLVTTMPILIVGQRKCHSDHRPTTVLRTRWNFLETFQV